MKTTYTVYSITRYSEGTLRSIDYAITEQRFSKIETGYQYYNDTTTIDECFYVSKLFTVDLEEGDREALDGILTLASLQEANFIQLRKSLSK